MPQVGLGHGPLKQSVPFYSDNRAVLSPTSMDPILFTGRSKPTTHSTMQDGIFNGEIGRNERDTLHTRTFIHLARITHTTQARQ